MLSFSTFINDGFELQTSKANGLKMESELWMTYLICEMSRNADFAKVRITPIDQVQNVWNYVDLRP